jgi:hypothetical protein
MSSRLHCRFGKQARARHPQICASNWGFLTAFEMTAELFTRTAAIQPVYEPKL